MKKLNVKSVIVGSIVSVGGSLVFGAIIGFVTVIGYISSYVSSHIINNDTVDNDAMKNFEEDVLKHFEENFLEYFYSNMLIMMSCLIIGLIFVSIGGYVAGKIAKQNEIYNALGVGILGMLLGILLSSGLPLWYNAAGFILTLPFAYFGGSLSFRANSKK